MIYLLPFLFFKIIISYRFRNGFFINLSFIINDLYLILSFYSIDLLVEETKILFIYNGIISCVFCLILTYVLSKFSWIDNFFENIYKNPIPIKYLLGILLTVMIVVIFTTNSFYETINNPRQIYTFLVKSNQTSGSIFFFLISQISALLVCFSTDVRRLILLTFIMFFTGSKGYLIAPTMFYILWQLRVKNFKILTLIPFAVYGLYSLLKINIRGKEDILKYILNDYFDYGFNINYASQKIFNLLPLDNHWIPALNDIFLGLSRITSQRRYTFFEEFFPSDFYLGLNPGLLDFEYIFRLGFVGYIFFMIILLLIKISLLYHFRSRLLFIALIFVNLRLATICLFFILIFNFFKTLFSDKFKKNFSNYSSKTGV